MLERAAEPTFPLAVEMHSRHAEPSTNVAATVDLLLRGQLRLAQERELTVDGSSWWILGANRPRRPVLAAVPMPPPDGPC